MRRRVARGKPSTPPSTTLAPPGPATPRRPPRCPLSTPEPPCEAARGLDRRPLDCRALDLTAVAPAPRVCYVARRGGARARLLRVRPHLFGAGWLLFRIRHEGAILLLDELSSALCGVVDAAELCRNVHPDPAYVEAANDVIMELSSYMQTLNTNKDMYKARKRRLSCESLAVAKGQNT